MNGSTFQICSFLICDEIRTETGGKQLIIGAYAGLILIPHVPFMGRMLTIRIEVLADRSHFDHVQCTVTRPNSTTFYHHDMPYDIAYPQYPIPIVFEHLLPNFEHSGDYTVFIAMDSAPTFAGTFRIITQQELSQNG